VEAPPPRAAGPGYLFFLFKSQNIVTKTAKGTNIAAANL
jgi:hypothetical protein